jgi:hypothetical protein
MAKNDPLDYRASDFSLADPKRVSQASLEQWTVATESAAGGQEVGQLPINVWRRVIVQGAMDAGWFSAMPEGFAPDQAGELRPGVIVALSDQVLSFYQEVTEPDENFTEPQ